MLLNEHSRRITVVLKPVFFFFFAGVFLGMWLGTLENGHRLPRGPSRSLCSSAAPLVVQILGRCFAFVLLLRSGATLSRFSHALCSPPKLTVRRKLRARLKQPCVDLSSRVIMIPSMSLRRGRGQVVMKGMRLIDPVRG